MYVRFFLTWFRISWISIVRRPKFRKLKKGLCNSVTLVLTTDDARNTPVAVKLSCFIGVIGVSLSCRGRLFGVERIVESLGRGRREGVTVDISVSASERSIV